VFYVRLVIVCHANPTMFVLLVCQLILYHQIVNNVFCAIFQVVSPVLTMMFAHFVQEISIVWLRECVSYAKYPTVKCVILPIFAHLAQIK